jgi:hypothetical protein
MALPILEAPKYSVRLPSNGKTIEYRPFLVKEEKVLMMAQESDSSREMMSAMKDIVKACTFNKIDPNELTSYDLEYLFLKLRAKSVGETTTIKIKCDKCDTYVPVEVNLEDVEIPVVSDKPVNIMLNDTVGITMRHVRVRDLASLTDEKKSSADIFSDSIIASIHAIFDSNGVYLTDETKKEELVNFVSSLSRSHMKQIEEYIAATPKISMKVKFTCTNEECKHENEVTLTGVKSFFA